MNGKRLAIYRKMIATFNNADDTLKGAGAPVGTPSRAGLRYLDTSTGLLYLSRNVLNFNGSIIATPTITGVRKVILQFWHNDTSPNDIRAFFDGLNGDAFSNLILAVRSTSDGNISNAGIAGEVFTLNGVDIATGTTNPNALIWNTLVTTANSDRKLTRIGSDRTNGSTYLGRITNVQILGASDVLLASYSIDEGFGTIIYDSSGNMRDGTLTLGSGSWQLDWVPVG